MTLTSFTQSGNHFIPEVAAGRVQLLPDPRLQVVQVFRVENHVLLFLRVVLGPLRVRVSETTSACSTLARRTSSLSKNGFDRARKKESDKTSGLKTSMIITSQNNISRGLFSAEGTEDTTPLLFWLKPSPGHNLTL